MPLLRRVGRSADALVHLDVPVGMSRECPAWMCDAAICNPMSVGSPQVAVSALVELRRVLPDGHFKFPHLWPVKLPRAGRPGLSAVEVVEGNERLAAGLTGDWGRAIA